MVKRKRGVGWWKVFPFIMWEIKCDGWWMMDDGWWVVDGGWCTGGRWAFWEVWKGLVWWVRFGLFVPEICWKLRWGAGKIHLIGHFCSGMLWKEKEGRKASPPQSDDLILNNQTNVHTPLLSSHLISSPALITNY